MYTVAVHHTLKVGVVARLHLSDGVAHSVTSDVEVSLVYLLLGFNMASHSISSLIEAIKVLQMTELITKKIKLSKTSFQLNQVMLYILKRGREAGGKEGRVREVGETERSNVK